MGLLPDAQNFALSMGRECRERFPRRRLQRKPLVCDPGMHHGTCFTHVPWCMSGSLTSGGEENVPGIPGACATRNFAYLVRGPWIVNRYQLFSESWHCSSSNMILLGFPIFVWVAFIWQMIRHYGDSGRKWPPGDVYCWGVRKWPQGEWITKLSLLGQHSRNC